MMLVGEHLWEERGRGLSFFSFHFWRCSPTNTSKQEMKKTKTKKTMNSKNKRQIIGGIHCRTIPKWSEKITKKREKEDVRWRTPPRRSKEMEEDHSFSTPFLVILPNEHFCNPILSSSFSCFFLFFLHSFSWVVCHQHLLFDTEALSPYTLHQLNLSQHIFFQNQLSFWCWGPIALSTQVKTKPPSIFIKEDWWYQTTYYFIFEVLHIEK